MSLYPPAPPTPAELAADAEERAAIADRPHRGPRFQVLSPSAIAAPPAPISYLLEALDICPGPPTLFAGYGYTGKTIVLQALALAIMAGGLAWGKFRVRRGVVAHLDYEQGQRLTVLRYQRLAAAHGTGIGEIAPALRLACLPRLYLNSPAAEDAIIDICQGVALLIVDSLAGSTPGSKENDPSIRIHLDMLHRVSQETGASVIMIHHMGKPPSSSDKAGARSATHNIRGSSAIFDACSSVVVLSRGDEGITAEHVKAKNSGRPHDALTLTVSDVDLHGDRYGGLAVRASEPEKPVEYSGRLADDMARLLSWITRESLQGRPVPGVAACARGVGIGAARARQALGVLLDQGSVLDQPTRSSTNGRYFSKIWATSVPVQGYSSNPTPTGEVGLLDKYSPVLDRSSTGRVPVE